MHSPRTATRALPSVRSHHWPVLLPALRMALAAPGPASDAVGAARKPRVCVEASYLWPWLRPSTESCAICQAAVRRGMCCRVPRCVRSYLEMPRGGEGWGKSSPTEQAWRSGRRCRVSPPITAACVLVPICLQHKGGWGEGILAETVCN